MASCSISVYVLQVNVCLVLFLLIDYYYDAVLVAVVDPVLVPWVVNDWVLSWSLRFNSDLSAPDVEVRVPDSDSRDHLRVLNVLHSLLILKLIY